MIIVITLPYFFPGEAERIIALLRRGDADLVHIRKPQATAADVTELIELIPTDLYPRLVLHDHHHLAVRYHLHGIHLNSRNPQPPAGWKGSISRSCHSLEELRQWKPRCHYLSLSPIYDSISKQGYHSAFTTEELTAAVRAGIIDGKVLALGGVTFQSIPQVLALGFGGAMILGDAWK